MKHLVLAAILSTTAFAAQADVGALFLPDFTFPTQAPAPVVSTQGCTPALPCSN